MQVPSKYRASKYCGVGESTDANYRRIHRQESSMELGLKIKSIRLEESLSQSDLAELIGISKGTLQNYEQGKNHLSETNLLKITNHPQLMKYALWLMTGQSAPESGQVCPVFSTQERCGLIELMDVKRA